MLDLARDEVADETGRLMRRSFGALRSGRPSAVIGCTKLFLDEADPTSAAEVARSVQRFYNDFPHVAASLGNVNVCHLPDGAYAGTADYHDGNFDISLNSTAYGRGRRHFLLDRTAEDYERGFHRFSTPTGSFEHELGHVIDLGLDSWGASQLNYPDALGISEYAMRGGPEEAFAEAFANWREGVRNTRFVDDVVQAVARHANSSGRWAA